MLTEADRKIILGLLTRMGVDPQYVARDGASAEGYRTFVFDPRVRQEDGTRLTRFVAWNERQLDLIWENEKIFNEWFSEGTVDENVVDAETIIAALTTGEYVTAEFMTENGISAFAGVHPAPGQHVDIPVILRVKHEKC